MNEQNVRVSVSVVADGETIGRFDSDTGPGADIADREVLDDESPETEQSSDAERTEGDAQSDDADSRAAATFELYRDAADEWRWRLRHDNGNIIADGGEGYSSKAAAKNGIESVRKNAPGASLVTR